MNTKALILTLALALPASLTLAQRPGGPPPGGQPPRGPAPGGFPPGPPPNEQQGGGETNQHRGKRPPKDGGDKEQPGKPPLAPLPLLRVLDADHDGIISAEEIDKAPDALQTLDKNKDGKLMPDEFLGPKPAGPPPGEPRKFGESGKKAGERPFPGQKPQGEGEKKPAAPSDGAAQPGGERDGEGKPPRPPAPPLVAALDADHNGVISADEIADAAKSLLTLDKNGDGQLGPVEYMGRPPGEHREGDGPKFPREGEGPKPPRPAPEEQ